MRFLSRPRVGRGAFTLIELLVVMVLIVVLASLALLISPRMAEDQRSSRGADLIQGWLLIAKSKASRDQVPRGIRLVLDPNNSNVVREMVYIERPEPLRFDVGDASGVSPNNNVRVQVPCPLGTPKNNTLVSQQAYSRVFLSGIDLQTGDIALGGDFLQFNTYETQPYNLHRIGAATDAVPVLGVQYTASYPLAAPPGPGTLLTLQAKDGTPNPFTGRIRFGDTTSIQIVRQPRPMAGESVLHLPRDVVIDFDYDMPNPPYSGQRRSYMPGYLSGGNPTDLDIIFSPRGQIMGVNGTDGKIVLRVRNVDKPADSGEQTLITIFTRTGLIAAFPVNNDPASLNDPFKFTRQGKNSGM